MSETPPPHRLGTKALHAGQEPDSATTSRAVPVYATTSYVFKGTDHAADLFALKEAGNIYSRMMNPTCDVLEQRLAALDGGIAGLSFSSGQAAITAALLSIVHSGQNFVSATSLYGGTWTLFTQTLKKLGIKARFFNANRPEGIEKLVDDKTRCVYLESVGNPKNDVPDFARVVEIAHRKGLPVIVDNTVLTPALFARSSTAPTSWSIPPRSSSAATASTSAARSSMPGRFPGRTIRSGGRSSAPRTTRITGWSSPRRSGRRPTSPTRARISCGTWGAA
jgi:O-acetylhomoserine/O-acetylserine sulfhydrylase-like pyridoxal-dependent enzyme